MRFGVGAKTEPNSACHSQAETTPFALIQKLQKIMKLFAALRKIREFEKGELPFLKSIVDFDIVIEIGFSEEEGRPLTLKQLFLMNISSRTTVRRRLAALIEKGIVVRKRHDHDHRSAILSIAPPCHKLLGKYAAALSTLSGSINS
jgi:hypothetical protein